MPEEDDLPPPEEELPARASARLGVRARLKQKNSATGMRQPARRCIGERIDIVKSRPWICSRGSPSGIHMGRRVPSRKAYRQNPVWPPAPDTAADCLIRAIFPPNL